MDLQTKVKDHLKRYGIKKIYLAALIGIYPSQLSEWLSGNYELL
jgi:DNA-binding transcriptional regulator YdaS (Cro superfamily)